jgi:hypothetical protein
VELQLSALGGVLEVCCGPGNVCCGVAVDGLAPNDEAGPDVDGDPEVPTLRRRLEDPLPSGSVGFNMVCTPRSLIGADTLQSSPDGAVCVVRAFWGDG